MKNDIILMSLIFITLAVPLSIGYIIISYIKSLENQKCACSADKKRKYISYYGYFLIISALLGICSFILYVRYPPFRKVKGLIKIFVLIIQFIAAYVIFTYSKLLEENKCSCSDSWKRVFLKYYGYGLTVFIGLLFFCLVMAFLVLISTGEKGFMLDIRKILLGCNM